MIAKRLTSLWVVRILHVFDLVPILTCDLTIPTAHTFETPYGVALSRCDLPRPSAEVEFGFKTDPYFVATIAISKD